MKYYYIKTSGMHGDSYYYCNFHPDFPPADESLKRINFVLKLDSDNLPYSFFSSHWNHYFIKSEFRTTLEEYGFDELKYEKVDKLIFTENYKEDNLSDFTQYDFLKVNIHSDLESLKDFYLWNNTHLVVSERALDVLYNHGGYYDIIEGQGNLKIITNKFVINDSIEDFFNHELSEIWSDINVKRKLINKEKNSSTLS